MIALYKDPNGVNIFPDNIGNAIKADIKGFDSNESVKSGRKGNKTTQSPPVTALQQTV